MLSVVRPWWVIIRLWMPFLVSQRLIFFGIINKKNYTELKQMVAKMDCTNAILGLTDCDARI